MLITVIILNQEDHCYRIGDTIAGKVKVTALSEATCSQISIACGWRTHGWGNRDEYWKKLVIFNERILFSRGEQKEFPFNFTISDGPLTYHGRYLNVDRYLAAFVDDCQEIEQDFLLLRAEPTSDLTEEILDDEEATSLFHHQMIELDSNNLLEASGTSETDLGVVLRLFAMCITIVLLLVSLKFMIIIAGLVLFYYFLKVISKQRLGLVSFWVKPNITRAGSKLHCHLDFRTKKDIFLKKIKASIIGQEVVTDGSGSDLRRFSYTIHEKSFVKPYEEHLSAGRVVIFSCAIPIPTDLPATFSSPNNKLIWTVTMEVEIKGWLKWKKTFPITVLA